MLIVAGLGCATPSAPNPQPGTPAPELRFSDFFVMPVGPRGLEPTSKLLGLRGQPVRVQGYMVEEEEPFPGFFMLTPLPVTIAERADGPADFLPPATLFVHLPASQRDRMLAHQPGLLEVRGTLDLGAQEEASGRFSYVRLLLEAPHESVTNTRTQGAME